MDIGDTRSARAPIGGLTSCDLLRLSGGRFDTAASVGLRSTGHFLQADGAAEGQNPANEEVGYPDDWLVAELVSNRLKRSTLD